MLDLLIYLTACGLATLRILGHKSQAFQAVAHLFVGGLFGAAFSELSQAGTGWKFLAWRHLSLAIALSVVEVACFLWFKLSGRSNARNHPSLA